MRTKRIKGISKTACQPWCTPSHKCGSPYCCPEVYTVPNPRNSLIRKGVNQVDGYGNAVTPAVGEWIGSRLRPVLHREEHA